MSIVKLIEHAPVEKIDGFKVLSKEGKEAAFEYGKKLADEYHGAKIIVNSSQLYRGIKTAELIMEGAGSQITQEIHSSNLHLTFDNITLQKIMDAEGTDFVEKSLNGDFSWFVDSLFNIQKYSLSRINNVANSVYVGIIHDPFVAGMLYSIFGTEDVRSLEVPHLDGFTFLPENKIKLDCLNGEIRDYDALHTAFKENLKPYKPAK